MVSIRLCRTGEIAEGVLLCPSLFSIPCRMWEYGIDNSDGTVVFGQLLGMCDHVTFTLGNTLFLSVYTHTLAVLHIHTILASLLPSF